ncbi:MAG: YitT family protein [Selenomonadaceae bacterium]
MSIWERYIIFTVGIIVQSAGIALVVKSMLGTSPISSLPYVLSLAYPFTLGQTTFAVNMVFLVGQIVLLRRRFNVVQLMQIPVTLVFAMFIDASMAVFSSVVPEWYPSKMAVLLIGASFVSLGVSLQVIAHVLMLAGEAIVLAISQVFHFEFGWVKTAFDCSLVASAAIFSYIQLGSIEGIREGTLISALITGSIARFFIRHLSRVDAQGGLVFAPHI